MWSPTPDQVAVIAAVAGVVAAVAGLVAGIFAVRADLFGRRQARHLDEQRLHDVKPGLRSHWDALPERTHSGGGALSVRNVGGAAVRFIWVGKWQGQLLVAGGSVPSHFTSYMKFPTHGIGEIPADLHGTATLWLLAQDADSSWWDCKEDQRISGDLRAYIAAQLTSWSEGVPDFDVDRFADQIFIEAQFDPDFPKVR